MDENKQNPLENPVNPLENSQNSPESIPDAPVASPEAQQALPEIETPSDGSMAQETQGEAQNAPEISQNSQQTFQNALDVPPTAAQVLQNTQTAQLTNAKPTKSSNKKRLILLVILLILLLAVAGVLFIFLSKNQETGNISAKQDASAMDDLGEKTNDDVSQNTPATSEEKPDLSVEEALARECALHPEITNGFVGRHWDKESQAYVSYDTDQEYAWISCDWGVALKAVPGLIMSDHQSLLWEGFDEAAYPDGFSVRFNSITTDTDFYAQNQGKELPDFYSNNPDGFISIWRMTERAYDDIRESGGGFASQAPLFRHNGFVLIYSEAQAIFSIDDFEIDWEVESSNRMREWVTDFESPASNGDDLYGKMENWVRF